MNQNNVGSATESFEGIKSAYDTQLNELNAQKTDLITEKGRQEANFNSQKSQLLLEKNQREIGLMKMSQDIYGTPYPKKPSPWKMFWLFLALLVVAGIEYPLNAAAFEKFERPQNETLLMAIAFGIIIAIFAECAGYGFKRYVVSKKVPNLVISIFAVSAGLVGLYIAAKLRFEYLTEMGGEPMPVLMQFFFSSIFFLAGAIVAYFFTSSARNLHAESAYKGEFKRLGQIEKSLKNLEAQKAKGLAEIEKKVKGVETQKVALRKAFETETHDLSQLTEAQKTRFSTTNPTN
jgi:cation transport ATPase